MSTSVPGSVRPGDSRTDKECHRKGDLTAGELRGERGQRQPGGEPSSRRQCVYRGLSSEERDGVNDEESGYVARCAKRMTSQVLRGPRDRDASVNLGGASRDASGSRPHTNVCGRIRPSGARSY